MVALAGFDSTTEKVSFDSTVLSVPIGTDTVWLVTPTPKVRVPLPAV